MNASSHSVSFAPGFILINGNIRTMDQRQPTAEAIAIHRNKIVALGTNAEIKALAGKSTRTIDASGKLVLPGFNDAHVHFLMGGYSLAQVNLRDAKTPEEMANRLAAFAREIPKGRWILGGGWDHENWPGAPLPTKEMIDAATPDHPVFVHRLDGHMALANSLAVQLSGVTKDTEEPAGGVIVRDEHGEPAGIFKDAAEALIKVPPRSAAEKRVAALATTEFAAQLGVTSVTDLSADGDVGLYQSLAAAGELKTRIYAVRTIVAWEALRDVGIRAGFGDDMIRIGGLKGFSDGSLGSCTALFFEPYSDTPDTRGLLFDQMLPEGIMNERVLGADKAGLQVIIHAIGDEANKRVLDIYEEAAKKNGQRDRRFRIEHAQHLRLSEIARFGQQEVIASVQPYHCADDGRWCEKRIGSERSKGTYAFRSLLDTGAVLACGTDWPIAPLNPLLSIKAAVTRQTLDGQNPEGWMPEQKLSVHEAVYAYTMGSAYAELTENVKGSLTPGKLADLVVIDRDIFTINPADIENAKVVLTMMDGRIVYEVK